jgi:hypothetical protein
LLEAYLTRNILSKKKEKRKKRSVKKKEKRKKRSVKKKKKEKKKEKRIYIYKEGKG